MNRARLFAKHNKVLLWSGVALVVVLGGSYYWYDTINTRREWIDVSCFKNYPLTRKTLDCGLLDQSSAHA